MKKTKVLKQELKETISILTLKLSLMTPGSYEHQRTAESIKTLTEALEQLESKELKKEVIKDVTSILVTLAVITFELRHIFTGKSFNLIPKR